MAVAFLAIPKVVDIIVPIHGILIETQGEIRHVNNYNNAFKLCIVAA